MRIYPFLVLILFLCTSSCRKKILKYNKTYEGFWAAKECPDVLKISNTGEADFNYYQTCTGGFKTYSGKARANKKTLKIGLNVFNIQEEPTIIDTINFYFDAGLIIYQSNTYMKLEDKVFYKLIGK